MLFDSKTNEQEFGCQRENEEDYPFVQPSVKTEVTDSIEITTDLKKKFVAYRCRWVGCSDAMILVIC